MCLLLTRVGLFTVVNVDQCYELYLDDVFLARFSNFETAKTAVGNFLRKNSPFYREEHTLTWVSTFDTELCI